MLTRPVFFVLVPSIIIIACGQRSPGKPVLLDNNRWVVGDSIWLRVTTVDSVRSADSTYEHHKRNKAVLVTVSGIGEEARIQWQEFGAMDMSSDSAFLFEQPLWFPSTRLEYRCDAHGAIAHLLNYPEVRSIADTLIRTYMSLVQEVTPEQSDRLYEWTMDSSRLMDGLMSDAELFHYAYGLYFTGDTGHWELVPDIDKALHGARFRAELIPNPLCDPATTVSFLLRAETDSVNYHELLTGTDLFAPMIDTFLAQEEPVSVSVDCCFDTLRDFPILIEEELRMGMKDLAFKRTKSIHLDARWTPKKR